MLRDPPSPSSHTCTPWADDSNLCVLRALMSYQEKLMPLSLTKPGLFSSVSQLSYIKNKTTSIHHPHDGKPSHVHVLTLSTCGNPCSSLRYIYRWLASTGSVPRLAYILNQQWMGQERALFYTQHVCIGVGGRDPYFLPRSCHFNTWIKNLILCSW